MTFLNDLARDLRHAVRVLAKSPKFTAVVVLTLALGIGAATAIFTVVDRVLLSPLQYRDAGRIVTVVTKWKSTGRITPSLTGGDLIDIREQAGLFSAFSPYIGGEVGVQVAGRGEFTGAYWVNAGFLPVFGVTPVYGRAFEDSEADRSAMVSLAFAQRNFNGGAAALGKTINVDNQAYEIVGILPAAFQYPDKADVWLASPTTPENRNRDSYNYRVVARLRPDVSVESARARMETIGARLESQYPATNRDKTFAAVPLRDRMVSQVRSTLYLLLGAVALVLLIACANVANLLLARTPGRARELAIRTAMGAGRWRIVRQLTAENVLLGIAAAIVGVVLAKLGLTLLLRQAPANLPRLNEVSLDLTAFAFAVLAAFASSILFGLAPAWQAARLEVGEALKQGGSRGVVGRGSHRLRDAVVVAEIALSLVLAIGAGLLFRSFVSLTTIQLGFRSEGLLVMYAHAPAHSLNDHLRVGRLYEDVLAQVRRIPGVRSAAGAMGLPAGHYGSNGSYAVEGKHVFRSGERMPEAGFRLASPDYLATMGIPLVQGREFTAQDVYQSPFVAVVSESLVRQVFPRESPLGCRIQLGLDDPEKWVTIVGVAGDVRSSPATPPGPEIYMPLEQHPFYGNEIQVAVRTSVPPASVAGAIRQQLRGLLPETAVKFTTMDDMLADSVATPRFRTTLVAIFAVVALLLAMAGVYGVMTYITAERTSELGVRLALGATPGAVVRLILGKAAVLAAIGLAVGVGASVAAGRFLTTMLFGLKSTDLPTYVLVLAAVGLTTVASAFGPAFRAGRIDPLRAIREE
jgi:predicted permease